MGTKPGPELNAVVTQKTELTARLRTQQKSIALIVRNHEPVSADNVVGLITKEQLGESLIQAVELFSD
jgi:hypothetical protein